MKQSDPINKYCIRNMAFGTMRIQCATVISETNKRSRQPKQPLNRPSLPNSAGRKFEAK